MTRNSGTRVGNGPGYGGPANGGGNRPTPLSELHKGRTMQSDDSKARLQERRRKADEMLDRVYTVGMDARYPSLAAANALAYHRIADLMPVEKRAVDLNGNLEVNARLAVLSDAELMEMAGDDTGPSEG